MRQRKFRRRVGKGAMAGSGCRANTDAKKSELNGSMHGSSKSLAIVQRELSSVSTVFGTRLFPAVDWGGGSRADPKRVVAWSTGFPPTPKSGWVVRSRAARQGCRRW